MPAIYKVYITRSGDGAAVTIGHVETLAAATLLVRDLDASYLAWEASGFEPTDDAALLAYEGCDVWALDTVRGTRYVLDNDDDQVWEVF